MHHRVLLRTGFLSLNASFEGAAENSAIRAHLPYPRISCHAAPQRAQRHAADSITMLH